MHQNVFIVFAASSFMEIGVALFVTIIAVVAIWVVLEVKRLKHKLFAIFLIGLVLFGYLSFSYTMRNNNIDLTTISGLFDASKIYLSWLAGAFDNIKFLTANAVKMDWSGNLSG